MINKIIIFTCIFATFAYAQWRPPIRNTCPPSGCPQPNRPLNCGAPDCSLVENRYSEYALFPTRDPTRYWQCAPLNATHWAALERDCACGTVFNPFIRNGPPRCTFWFDEGWIPDQTCGWVSPPNVRDCPIDCPSCLPSVPGTTTTTQGPNLTPPPPGSPPDTCPCPCPPCIWWPCTPCQPANNCPCNQNRG